VSFEGISFREVRLNLMSNLNNIITISQEEGSGGREIARYLARKLKLRLVDEQFIRAACQKLGLGFDDFVNFDLKVLPKLVELTHTPQDFFLSEVLVPEQMNFGYGYRPENSTTPKRPTLKKETVEELARSGYQKLIDNIIREVAEQGQVIFLDLGANFVLKNWPQVLNLRIVGPVEDRIERLAYTEKITNPEAEIYIKDHDQQQQAYIRQFYGPDCTDPAFYHLVINTANVSLPAITDSIYKFVQQFEASYKKADALEVHRSYNRLVEQDSYTLEEAAHLLWLDQDVLRKAVYRGELKGKVIDHNVIRISRQALLDWFHLRKVRSQNEQTH